MTSITGSKIQCDQIGQFYKVLATNFRTKVAQTFGASMARYFEKYVEFLKKKLTLRTK